MNRLNELEAKGQAIWLDFIDRRLIRSGELRRYVEEDGVSGVTSNPSIFEKAIAGTGEYDAAIDRILARGDRDALSLYEELALKDIRDAADILLPGYERSEGRDGFVSLEVSPLLAFDTHATVRDARRLWDAVDRPNVMIKVPGTGEGIPAIRQLVEDGINVNITLLFSLATYERVAEAYLAGLEARRSKGAPIDRIASIASFFLSRIDTAVDQIIESRLSSTKEADKRDVLSSLLGKAAIASAKLASETFGRLTKSERWRALENAGARPQRLLWASTSTKNPKYRDVMYVEELIGPQTVNTLPKATIAAFKDHGRVEETLANKLDEAKETLENLRKAEIDLEEVTKQLLVDGISKFSEPFGKLLSSLEGKRTKMLGKRLSQLSYRLPETLEKEVEQTLTDWSREGKVRSEWNRDASLWTHSGEERWLGWLDMPMAEMKRADDLQGFAREIRDEGFRFVILLGMGGSSLGAEVLGQTFGAEGRKKGFPEFHILDSTDPSQIKSLEEGLDLERTLFIVSSKSGSTLEPNIFFEYFYDRVQKRMGQAEAGQQFVAITDPGASLERRAKENGFRRIFYGVPSIGGRYSVLSNFGMLPAALIGVDLKRLLSQTLHMVWSCSKAVPAEANPGVILGAILGVGAKAGRNKVTLICSNAVSDFGAWAEQLLAESTGKQGKGLVPINREPLGAPESYGSDRIFIYLSVGEESDAGIEPQVVALEKAGHPVVRIKIAELYDLGQEFFRWEMATSVVGSMLGINPFDQPDVEASKVATQRLTSEFEAKGALPAEEPIFQTGDIQIFDDPENAAELKKRLGKSPGLSDYLRAHLDRVHAGDYFAILAYLPMNPEDEEILESMRAHVRQAKKVATCVEFGPRFLHSTGQAYKGGPNSGVFLQITGDDKVDLPIPGHGYTFGVVKAAEARGDFEVLAERRRRAMRIHLRGDLRKALGTLHEELERAVA